MKVLVLGNEGYLGCIMTEMLLKEGYGVTGIDGGYFKDAEFIKKPQETLNITQIHKDSRDLTLEDVAGHDAIIHLAALSNDPAGELNPDWTQQINHEGVMRNAKLAKQAGIQRFIFSSSCSLYGAAGNSECDETSPFNPVSTYAKCKVSVEKGLSEMADENFSPTFMRNATVYGASPRMRFDIVINNLSAWGYLTGKIKILGDGTPWRPNVHARDLCNAFIATLKAPIEDIHNEAFNVGILNENYQVKDLANFVAEVIPNTTVEILGEGITNDNRSYKVNFSKIYRVLKHYKPEWNIKKGIEELYQHFQDTKLTMETFEHEDFITLKKYKNMVERGEVDENLFILPSFFEK